MTAHGIAAEERVVVTCAIAWGVCPFPPNVRTSSRRDQALRPFPCFFPPRAGPALACVVRTYCPSRPSIGRKAYRTRVRPSTAGGSVRSGWWKAGYARRESRCGTAPWRRVGAGRGRVGGGCERREPPDAPSACWSVLDARSGAFLWTCCGSIRPGLRCARVTPTACPMAAVGVGGFHRVAAPSATRGLRGDHRVWSPPRSEIPMARVAPGVSGLRAEA